MVKLELAPSPFLAGLKRLVVQPFHQAVRRKQRSPARAFGVVCAELFCLLNENDPENHACGCSGAAAVRRLATPAPLGLVVAWRLPSTGERAGGIQMLRHFQSLLSP